MEILTSINKIFEEINNYSGNFGDPIVEHVDFNPLDYVGFQESGEVRLGAAIALLVNFSSEVDNSTFSNAQNGKVSQDIAFVIEGGFYKDAPEIHSALKSSRKSEKEFYDNLKNIYHIYVKGHANKSTP